MTAMAAFQEKARQAIPAEVHMISGSQDSQTSSDVFNVGAFALPDPAGKAGGACTSALLKVLYSQKQPLTWVSLLRQMRQVLKEMNYDQIPQLTSSRLVDVEKPMYIVPPESKGTKRAVLIGIRYVGQVGELGGCHNDVLNMKKYLEQVHGFRDPVILMDDGKHTEPTKKNILNAFQRVAEQSKSGDVVFIHYSGKHKAL
jgi:metacaspase-1